MLDDKYIKGEAQRLFPDLINTKITFNNQLNVNYFETLLLPFLIFQNTVDQNHRLIGLYMPDSTSSNHMVPFFVILAQYRKALNSIMSSSTFKSESFELNHRQVRINGSICSVTSVDFVNRQLVIHSASGYESTISFMESYKVSWDYRNSHDIRDKIESFEKLDRANTGNIFNFPLTPNQTDYEGVIIFTNIIKFEQLLNNVKISGSDLKDYLNIKKAVFSSDQKITFVSLSHKKTLRKPVSVVIARLDAFRSYENILAAAGGSLNHIKTIIIDDFSNLINRWDRKHALHDELNWLNENYFQKLMRKELKDIYLISEAYRLDINDILLAQKINYRPWLMLPLEQKKFTQFNPFITVTRGGDWKFEEILEKFFQIISRWKELAQTNFCNGEILNIIYLIYGLRKRINTFFNLPNFIQDVYSLLANLKNFREKWFFNGSDFNTINDTESFLNFFFINENQNNYKLDCIINFIRKYNFSGVFIIVGDNGNAYDINWGIKFMKEQFPHSEFLYYTSEEYLRSSTTGRELPKSIFYLNADHLLIGKAFSQVNSENQIFVLSDRAFQFCSYFSKKYLRNQFEIGSDVDRYNLLNLVPPVDTGENLGDGLLQLEIYESEVIDLKKEQFVFVVESDLQDMFKQVIENQHGTQHNTLESYFLFFSDGSVLPMRGNRSIFCYEDDTKDEGDLDDLRKAVEDLEINDQLILPKQEIDIKDLINQALRKNDNFMKMLDVDQEWRELIKNYILQHRWTISFFREKLRENGFIIDTDLSVQEWIESERRRPQHFTELLFALSWLNVIKSERISLYNKCNLELKSQQIKFFRIAIKKLVAKLNGIYLPSSDIYTDDLLNEFLNLIDIKTIIGINKI